MVDRELVAAKNLLKKGSRAKPFSIYMPFALRGPQSFSGCTFFYNDGIPSYRRMRERYLYSDGGYSPYVSTGFAEDRLFDTLGCHAERILKKLNEQICGRERGWYERMQH